MRPNICCIHCRFRSGQCPLCSSRSIASSTGLRRMISRSWASAPMTRAATLSSTAPRRYRSFSSLLALYIGHKRHEWVVCIFVCLRLKHRPGCNTSGAAHVRFPAQVLIAQESMSRNQVYAFQKKQPHKYAYTAEVRSATETGMQPAQAVYVLLNARGSDKAGRTIESTLPYIRAVCAFAGNVVPCISQHSAWVRFESSCIVSYVRICICGVFIHVIACRVAMALVWYLRSLMARNILSLSNWFRGVCTAGAVRGRVPRARPRGGPQHPGAHCI